MKVIHYAYLFMGLFGANQLHAQEVLTGADAKKMVSNSEIVRTSKYGAVPSYIKYAEPNAPNTSSYLSQVARLLKLDEGLQLVSQKENDDNLGFVHYRFYEAYNGIPIEYTAWYAHSKNGKIVSANGFLHKNLPNAQGPAITGAQALQYALNSINATTYKWQLPQEESHLKVEQKNPEATYYPQPELVYAPKGDDYSSDMYRIAYKMNIYAHEPLSRNLVYVDAQTGEILNTVEQIHHTDVLGSANTGYSGNRPMTADSTAPNNFRLRESGRGNGIETYNLLQGTSYGAAVDFTDTDNFWNNANAQWDQYATDAHWGSEITYDYYLNNFNRNSIDGNGFALISYIHYSTGYNNAFWDGQRMTYGDGTGNPLTSPDVTGHEITHGLTSNTANLVYADESGALNESFSDIFGVAIERYGRPNNWNWTMGEDFGSPFRSMSNPNALGDPDTYFGNNWAPLGGADNGGVHTNSSVQNYWFYLLSDGGSGVNDNGDSYSITGIGFDNASDVSFRNLTVYLTPSSDFAEARFFAIQSAVDLYGACTPNVGAVTDAWYAVGVGQPYLPYANADFEANVTSSCIAPHTVNFSNSSVNGGTYMWNFGDGSTSTAINPSHTYTSFGSYNVTLSINGGACGVDDTTKVDFVEIYDSLPCLVTMPTNGTATTQTSCYGKVYDSGGPNGSYGANETSVITIAPTGAQNVSLTFLSFSIEAGTGSSCNYDYLNIYDGPTTGAPLIGTYCNNNIPTNIQSTNSAITILFSSDQGVEESGFEVEWICNLANSAPNAKFTSNLESTCSGDVQFTDQSSSFPTQWAWDFGDGTTDTAQNPLHHYANSGVYTVELVASNAFGAQTATKTNYIAVNLTTAPLAFSDTACAGNSVNLVSNTAGVIRWYDDLNSTVSIHTGDTFTTPALNTTTTYYVDSESISLPQNVGPANNSFGGGGSFNGDQSLVFDVYSSIILESVLVYATQEGMRIIELRNSNNDVLERDTVVVPDGQSRVTLNFAIEPGTDYQLGVALNSAPALYRNNSGASYPYTIPNKVSITTSTAGGNYYYFFYDWIVKDVTCRSERVGVDAEIKICASIESVENMVGVSVYPNPANTQVMVSFDSEINYDEASIKLLNTVGQEVLFTPITKNNTSVNVSALADGVYFIQITANDQTQIKKLIIK